MNILMFTNTFAPHVGGVARSIQQFTTEFRRRGHSVLVVAPEYANHIDKEVDVVRIPAIQNFNGSDFSVPVPIPGFLNGVIRDFQPQIVHTHHPFLLGDTAVRFSASYDIPLVFTHHTQYEQYTHYIPGDSSAMKRFAIELSVGYSNLCDAVIAPSATIQQRLVSQGVTAPIVEIPTGVDTALFGSGSGVSLRKRLGIPSQRFVVGHVGRLAPEKGLGFLANAVACFVQDHDDACFVVAGSGPSVESIERAFAEHHVSDRLVLLGSLERNDLPDVYAAMDVFAFASQSETQGMVLTEAMAAGTPVVAVDAPGVREVVRSQVNGLSLETENTELFVYALHDMAALTPAERQAFESGAKETASEFSMEATATETLKLYGDLIASGANTVRSDDAWSMARRRIEEEWRIWSTVAGALGNAVLTFDLNGAKGR